MFLSKSRQQEIIQDVANSGKGFYARLGMVAGSICRKESLYYCTSCVQDDVEKNGEPYIHREHQLQGIDYCPHHEVPLRKYPVTPISASRIEFIRFEMEQMDLSHIYEVDPYGEIKIHLVKQAYELLKQPLHLLSRQALERSIFQCYSPKFRPCPSLEECK
ncbi:TniQ family protein [Pseudogracilibacillus sp. SO30301A]|uniref:TniQ family protein n=1 Tax=Pseudogracilibacillus sp. SO30301A TaxID=3098291 RepID=UPI00300E0CD9